MSVRSFILFPFLILGLIFYVVSLLLLIIAVGYENVLIAKIKTMEIILRERQQHREGK